MNKIQINKNIENTKIIPKLRLQCYFFEGVRKEWKYNGDWLVDYYKNKYKIDLKNQRSAILYKIKQIKEQCKRMIVYDNREEAEAVVWLEIIDQKIMVNNTGIAIKELKKMI